MNEQARCTRLAAWAAAEGEAGAAPDQCTTETQLLQRNSLCRIFGQRFGTNIRQKDVSDLHCRSRRSTMTRTGSRSYKSSRATAAVTSRWDGGGGQFDRLTWMITERNENKCCWRAFQFQQKPIRRPIYVESFFHYVGQPYGRLCWGISVSST